MTSVLVNNNSKYHHIGLHVCIFESFTSKIGLNELLSEDHFSILIVNFGSLRIQINNRKIDLSVNELIVIPKRAACEILIMSDHLQIYQLSFTSEFASQNSIRWPHIGYFEFFITQITSKIFLNTKEAILLIDLFKLLNSKALSCSTDIYKNEILLFSFNLLLYELASIYQRSSWHISVKHSRKEKLVMQFFKILEENYRKHHSAKFYADTLGVTTGHLTRIIKEVTEKTVKQCIEETIVLEAKILLQNKDLTILYITEELQFPNPSFFSNFFKRHTSLSPSEYRLRLNFH